MKKMNNIKKILITMLVAVMLISNIPASARVNEDYDEYCNDKYFLEEKMDHELWHKAKEGFYYKDTTGLETKEDVWGASENNIDYLATYLGTRNDSDVNDKTKPYDSQFDLYIIGQVLEPISNSTEKNVKNAYKQYKNIFKDYAIGEVKEPNLKVKLNKDNIPVLTWNNSKYHKYVEIQRRQFVNGKWTEWTRVAVVTAKSKKYTDKNIYDYVSWSTTVQYSVRFVADAKKQYMSASRFSTPVAVTTKSQKAIKFVDNYFGATVTYSSSLTSGLNKNSKAYYDNYNRDLVIEQNNTKVTYKFVSGLETDGKNYSSNNEVVTFTDTGISVTDKLTGETVKYYLETIVSGKDADNVAKKATPSIKSAKKTSKSGSTRADITITDAFGAYYSWGYKGTDTATVAFDSTILGYSNKPYVSTDINAEYGRVNGKKQKYITHGSSNMFYTNLEIDNYVPNFSIKYSKEYTIGGINLEYEKKYSTWTKVELSDKIKEQYTIRMGMYGEKIHKLFGDKYAAVPVCYTNGETLALVVPGLATNMIDKDAYREGASHIRFEEALFIIIEITAENSTGKDILAKYTDNVIEAIRPKNMVTTPTLDNGYSENTNDCVIDTKNKKGESINTTTQTTRRDGSYETSREFFGEAYVTNGNGTKIKVQLESFEYPDRLPYEEALESIMNIFKSFKDCPADAVKSKKAFINYVYEQAIKYRKAEVEEIIAEWKDKKRDDGEPFGVFYVQENHSDWMLGRNRYRIEDESVLKEYFVREFCLSALEKLILEQGLMGVQSFAEMHDYMFEANQNYKYYDGALGQFYNVANYNTLEEALADLNWTLGDGCTLLDAYLTELYC